MFSEPDVTLNRMRNRSLLLPVVCVLATAVAAEDLYQKPPKAVLDVLNAPAPFAHSVNPVQTTMLLARPRRYPPIAEVSAPFLRLAGVRINPHNSGPHLPPIHTELFLLRLYDGLEYKVDLPPNPRLSMPVWSPDGEQFAFLNYKADTIDLWVGEASQGRARHIQGVRVNAAFGEPIRWMPNNQSLIVQTVPATRGRAPAGGGTPKGPRIQEGSGKAAPVRTYQDLLTNQQDEALFEYYATSQLVMVDLEKNAVSPLGRPALYDGAEPSPDGKFLLVTKIHRPFSYWHPFPAFPKDIEIWDRSAKLVKKVASLPLADSVPIEGVPSGPRNVAWRGGDGATVVWVEALDGGNPKEKVPHRDRVLMLKPPFTEEPAELLKTEHRFQSMEWGQKGTLLVRDYERDRRWVRTFLLNADQKQDPKVLFERSIQDRYKDPGQPRLVANISGYRVLEQVGDDIFLVGDGASPKGDRPFLDRMNLVTGKKDRLFQSAADKYERPVAILDKEAKRIVIARESPTEPPNYVLLADGKELVLTHYKDPAPQLRAITKQLVTYKRADGVQLSFTLYLPPAYTRDKPLPTIVWAYPREFNDAEVAGQVSGSTQRFTSLVGPTHLFLLLAGYAVLDDATMPVVGSPEVANNTYVEQIVSSAKAAIDKAAEMGVTDPKRVGVGGHSYGAFMTANLLAHSDLFRAGVARSGAYNRTLTPFGFQNERRTFWEAPDLYLKMSPFMVANKIKTPILLIHGEADNNPGTFPIQSERMYQAIRGNGGTIRYVTLPFESHGYAGRESVEHTLYEMISWFDRWVKKAE